MIVSPFAFRGAGGGTEKKVACVGPENCSYLLRVEIERETETTPPRDPHTNKRSLLYVGKDLLLGFVKFLPVDFYVTFDCTGKHGIFEDGTNIIGVKVDGPLSKPAMIG